MAYATVPRISGTALKTRAPGACSACQVRKSKRKSEKIKIQNPKIQNPENSDCLRDCFAEILSYAGVRAVETEKMLQPCEEFQEQLQQYPWVNTDRDARMDIVSMGLWAPDQMSYMDVRVCHPMAPSYLKLKVPSLYKNHENSKKRSYMRRVQIVEGGTFTALVFTTTGGVGPEMANVLRQTAKTIETKCGERYSEALATIRRKLRFCLLISTLRSLRGCRTKYTTASLQDIDFNL